MQEYHKEVYKHNIPFKDFLKNHNIELLNKLTCDVAIKLIKEYMKKIQIESETDGEVNILIEEKE